MRRCARLLVPTLLLVLAPAMAPAQIAFPKSEAYIALGDSVAAGTGAVPVTNGYPYQLYDQGVFGVKKEVAFSNIALRGARSWELRDHQVPQVLCAEPPRRPTIVTVTAGANDIFRNDPDIPAIARRVAEAIDLLLNNGAGLVNTPVVDPFTGAPCRPLENVTILVSNYYSIPHPSPAIAALLDDALRGFDQALRFWLQFVPVPGGSRIGYVDLYTPSLGRQGLTLVERRLGVGTGLFDFEVHPTNLGHSFIAARFREVWEDLQD